MRQDFNKQLTERERIGSERRFHDVRGAKNNAIFDEDAKGGKESMHRRRRETFVDRKSFNENLNPLRNFIRCNVGRPWDKVFSELNAAFDRRKVINNHIFEHLFQYVHVKDVQVHNGQVCLLERWARGRYVDGKYHENGDYDDRFTPIKKANVEWYVDPRDGILKTGVKRSKRSVKKDREKATEQAVNKVFRVVDADNHLYLEDGIWMVYGIQDDPAPVEQLVAPPGMMSYVFEAMTKAQKREVGVKRLVRPPCHKFTPPVLPGYVRYDAGPGRHYATRTTASKKLLKQFDLEGTAVFKEDEVTRSHREMSKYRKAA